MQKRNLAIALIVLLVAPLSIYQAINIIRSYLPPTEAAIKTPRQFETAFNEIMADEGMSIDLESANYGIGNGYAEKTVPVHCADGSEITCRVVTTSERRKAMIILLEFEQPYDGTIPSHTKALLAMLLRVFETPMYEEQERSYQSALSYHEVINRFHEFEKSDDAEVYMRVASNKKQSETLILKRVMEEAEEQPSLLLRLDILTSRVVSW